MLKSQKYCDHEGRLPCMENCAGLLILRRKVFFAFLRSMQDSFYIDSIGFFIYAVHKDLVLVYDKFS